MSFIKPLPKDAHFAFRKHGDLPLTMEQFTAIQANWHKNLTQYRIWWADPNLYNGVVYAAKCQQEGSTIVIDLWKSSYAHKMASGKKVDGLVIPLMERANAPILVESEGHYLLGLHRTNQIILACGVLDEKHAQADHPLLANAQQELAEEFGLSMSGDFFFGYWIKDGPLNHFIVKLKCSLSIQQCIAKFKENLTLSPNPEILEIFAVRKDLTEIKNFCEEHNMDHVVWKWLLPLLEMDLKQ